jgi:hypothetical protein
MSLKWIWLVDVAGLEPAAPCLQTRQGKTLTALSGVAYTENQQDFRSLKYPEVVPNQGGGANAASIVQVDYSRERREFRHMLSVLPVCSGLADC